MKVLLQEEGAILVQNRDLRYLKKMGVNGFFYLSIEGEDEAFQKITDKVLVEPILMSQEITSYFDYLRLDLDSLRQQTDFLEDVYATSLSLYEEKSRKNQLTSAIIKQIVKKRYDFISSLEMMQNKQLDEHLISIPFGISEKDGDYHQENDTYICYATDVKGVYAFSRKDNHSIKQDEAFSNYCKEQLYPILADVSSKQQDKREDYAFHIMRDEHNKTMYLMVYPAQKQHVKTKTK